MVDVVEQSFGAVVFFFHVIVKYLNVASIEVRDSEIGIELDGFNMVLSAEGGEPGIEGFEFLEDFVSNKDFESKYFFFLELGLVRIVGV